MALQLPLPTPGAHARDSNLTLSPLLNPSLHNYSLRNIHKIHSLSRYHPSKSTIMVVKCGPTSDNQETGGTNGSLKNSLSNIVDKRVEELLSKEENKELLEKLNKATERVEVAKKQLADIQRQELEAQRMREYMNELEARASEIAACQNEVLEARVMVEEAERSLSMSNEARGEISRDEERFESVKAASISALVGTLAAAPIYLSKVTSSPELLLQLGVTFASCALFGVTFRYAVRRDLDDSHLKSGASAAFAVVKGLATLSGGSPLEFNSASFISHAADGALLVVQDLFIFTFAAVSLDFCFKTRFVSPFPINKE